LSSGRKRNQDERVGREIRELVGSGPNRKFRGLVEEGWVPRSGPAGVEAGGLVAGEVNREILQAVAGQEGQKLIEWVLGHWGWGTVSFWARPKGWSLGLTSPEEV
jgi:hypothetical protein